MVKILAKSVGVDLLNHSNNVSKFAVEIAKQSLLEVDDALIEGIRLGGLLHDIGKCTVGFQKKLNKTSDEDNLEYKLPYRHNEVGWAFINQYLDIDRATLNTVLDVIYWHHGISNEMGSYFDTDIKISNEDNDRMLEYLKSVVDNSSITKKPFKSKIAPSYFLLDDTSDEINTIRTFARTCIISADRLVSSLEISGSFNPTDSEITSIILDINSREKINIDNCIYSNTPRFELQKLISTQTEKTTIIKAPAGFGKTLLGLLWSANRNKKLIWVCPRNMVAESVYKIVLEELVNLGIDSLSVELYLTNQVISHNKNFTQPFSSDVIITNIDSYLSPSVDNRNAGRLFSIINSDVIFDEFHELVSDAPLFACFVNLMCVRHRLTNGNTLLLSATPMNMHSLWDSVILKTKVLPNEDEHFPAPHDIPYKINTANSFEIKDKTANNLIIFNTISNAQREKSNLGTELLIHSGFIEGDREKILNKIYDNYGKNKGCELNKPSLVGTHIIQASLDISCNNLYESVFSPEATLQRSGRCNRFGTYETESSINIINLSDKGENKIRELLYLRDLCGMWFEHMSGYNGQSINLNKLYEIYNEFNVKFSEQLHRYLVGKHNEGLRSLKKIYPVKFYEKKNNKDIKTAGSNKLRSSTSEIFVICKVYNTDTYSEPISVRVYGNNYIETFGETGNILNRILKTMKSIRNTNDSRYDYNDILDNPKITLDGVRILGKKSNTPYIRFDKVYHPAYGIISEGELINLKK
jgi:CRISPR-associated endonuclease Cas3-HD